MEFYSILLLQKSIWMYRNTTWQIQPAQRRALDTMYTTHNIEMHKYSMVDTACSKTALDTMYIAHNTKIQKYNMVDTACSKTGSRHHVRIRTLHTIHAEIQKYNMADTACSKTGSRRHVHCTQHRDAEIQHAYGGYSLLKDGLSTPCTLHTTQRYRNTTWWIQPAQRRALDTMYIAHNKEIQKYNMVDTACSKTGSRHHVHCTQQRNTEIQHGGYSLLKDGLSTPCTLHTTKKYRNTTWWIQPAQRRALDTMYIAHNKEIQKYNMVDTACSKTGSQHHVHP